MKSQLEFHTGDVESRATQFVDLLLPIPIPQLFTYRVPREMDDLVEFGKRVIVQFGRRKILTGVIIQVHENPPANYEAKYVLDILDPDPSFTQPQIEFMQWMADYYMCHPGEVLNVGMPAGLKLSSESKIQANPDFEDPEDLNEKELALWDALQNNDLIDYSTASDILGLKNISPVIKSMISKKAIILLEQIKDRYKPKVVKRIRLNPDYLEESAMEELFQTLAKKPKQEAILLRYLHLLPVLQDPQTNPKGVLKKDLLRTDHQSMSPSSLKTLIKNEVLEEFEEVVSRFESTKTTDQEIHLTPDQENAFQEILEAYGDSSSVLFQGVTGSGKTEIYIRLIQEIMEQGGQVLYLLPEIALTTQIVKRLKKVFGDKMGIFHSKYSVNERVEVWNGVLSGNFQLVVGVRSAIFLPFDHLDLVIVDEEHEPSYKAFDPAPRYHARDSALKLASIHHAKTLLGSATPSMESSFHAREGKYKKVNLTKRYGDAKLPKIELVDLNAEKKRKTLKEHFSSVLIEEIDHSISRGNQVIIFQNRRGYAPYLSCEECHWIPKCTQCSVSLTYHRFQNELICHYCGQRQKPPANCLSCGSNRIKMMSYGTEKLEEDLKDFFPEVSIQRMDLDTTRSKYSYEQIIGEFSDGKTQILVGTQMITKGLDFSHVDLVGVLDTDRMMNFPDFRSFERTFQLLIQVGGRSGRREQPGKVLIQTQHPSHPLFQMVVNHDFDLFYENEIPEREKFNYPPFTRLIKLVVKHGEKEIAYNASVWLARSLEQRLTSKRVLGPQEPIIGKIRNQYLMDILIKLERENINLAKAKQMILASIHELQKEKAFRNTIVQINVDPI